MTELLGATIESWVIGYFLLLCGFIFVSCIALYHTRMLNKLRKHKTLITRKGTYTFTEHKEIL